MALDRLPFDQGEYVITVDGSMGYIDGGKLDKNFVYVVSHKSGREERHVYNVNTLRRYKSDRLPRVWPTDLG